MNKQFLFVILTLSFVQHSFAQTGMENSKETNNQVKSSTAANYPSESAISLITPEIGVTSATVQGDATGYDYQSGFNVGVAADIGRSDLVLETGILYRQEGGKASTDAFTVNVHLDYLAVPLLGKYYFSGPQVSSAYFKLGLVPNVLMNDSAESRYGNIRPDDVNAIVLDAMVGLGGKIKMGQTNDLMIELVYSRGLTSAASDAKVYSNVFGLNVGVGFEL